ncbi:MAG: hypothetical protein NC225_03480 [Clostridium sp.]|nr:hypothetical protein [Clostridium sp.]MCM1398528.1 hypothetical protein [Clostridium sp.]MCM1460250.1 hypothetical protein [Bacteroides sp.]
MPSINRIRVNNVKYNFGTQFYDDFTMRMYGKNTLYDLANGGGKSVLMLLLLQNMIPNCTLDEKQPIEKLFRTGNGNTTIHSLVEWKLDKNDSSEGYRYMTTGFCARKAKESGDESETSKDVACIEYYNYCIFYREYNKNDIINLPLVKDGERVTFQGLRSYLKELEHKDMSLKVQIFDRKGEYQRFISEFGLHESQWEIIRGINKTEGHVRTYFENNYKTTRRVVEDLLIEEIIEKAFMVKTQREETGDAAMAQMLMDIKEQLTILAKKKKDIAGYDRQIELVGTLSDKVASFMDLYEEKSRLEALMANIYVTGEEFAKNDEEMMEQLAKERDEKRQQKDEQRKYMECLKVARDRNKLNELKGKLEQSQTAYEETLNKLDELKDDLNLKEAINEYVDYLADRKKYHQNDAVIKTMMSQTPFDRELLFSYTYNLKMRMDAVMAELNSKIDAIKKDLAKKKADRESAQMLLQEAMVEQEVAVNIKKTYDEEIVQLSEQLAEIKFSMSTLNFATPGEHLGQVQEEIDDLAWKLEDNQTRLKDNNEKLSDAKIKLSQLLLEKEENDKLIEAFEVKEKEYDEACQKLENIRTVYGSDDRNNLTSIITDRITSTVLENAAIKDEIKIRKKRVKLLEEGRIISASAAAKKLMDYLETRHGISAMFGMDYLSALPVNKQAELLEINPELPYGLLIKEYETVKDDPNILKVDTGSEIVNIYDMDAISDKALIQGENIISVHATKEFLTGEDTREKLLGEETENVHELEMKTEFKEEMLAAYRQDQQFVIRMQDSELMEAGRKLRDARKRMYDMDAEISTCKESIREIKRAISELETQNEELRKQYDEKLADVGRLDTATRLADMVSEKEAISGECKEKIDRLEEEIRSRRSLISDTDKTDDEDNANLATLEKKLQEMMTEWDVYYKPYYNIDVEYEVSALTDDEIKARFTAMLNENKGEMKTIEDKKLVMETLKNSMDKTLRNIKKRGISTEMMEEYEKKNLIYLSDDAMLDTCKKNINEQQERLNLLELERKELERAISRLEGSIEYAISNIEAAFGGYTEQQAEQSEIVMNLKKGKEMLERLEAEAKECDARYKGYMKQQGYMVDLYKDVKRIIVTHDIGMEQAKPLAEDKDKLRTIFEDNLLLYDKSNKAIEKAKNELMRFKGNTAVSLDEMEVYELAATIRNDVAIPESFGAAGELMNNLKAIADYIKLEKDRVEKSLVDMETIKANFEEQCLQRCLDVKTELDKLPKLSRIVVDGEAIQMVGLAIPYVRDEFLKQKMSDYIDRIVAQADDYDNDKDRIKFIRGSLALKKLFGVIVADMNGIKLSLYKRERIKEQSRYLRYEEAVGSTGQSQGIYIQFLVSIINYISGMYQLGNEDTRTKTIFIDNPFGAAKDVYIWEPIFALLAANNVQLIVPARGATPAITGRFDVNYILGQQMTGGRQLTVVCDYTSKADQEELEYKDLEFEQVSFDFI